MLEISNISPFIDTWKEYQWKDTVQHEHFFSLDGGVAFIQYGADHSQ